MAKLVCSATISNSNERDLICEWLRGTEGCSYSVIGHTVMATYPGVNKDNSDVYWGIVHMFEQYQEHSITHSAKGGQNYESRL